MKKQELSIKIIVKNPPSLRKVNAVCLLLAEELHSLYWGAHVNAPRKDNPFHQFQRK